MSSKFFGFVRTGGLVGGLFLLAISSISGYQESSWGALIGTVLLLSGVILHLLPEED